MSEENKMASDIKALAHLEDISNNLDQIRKELQELSAIANALIHIQKALEQIAERA